MGVLEGLSGVANLTLSHVRVSVPGWGTVTLNPSALGPSISWALVVEQSDIDTAPLDVEPVHLTLKFVVANVGVTVVRLQWVVDISFLWIVTLLWVKREESAWSDTVIVHDKEVAEESTELLHHTDLQVGEGNHLLADEVINL